MECNNHEVHLTLADSECVKKYETPLGGASYLEIEEALFCFCFLSAEEEKFDMASVKTNDRPVWFIPRGGW